MPSAHVAVANSRKARYVARLDSPRGIQQELAKLYIAARRGELDSSDAYRLGMLLSMLSKSMEVTTLATQLEELEAASATNPTLRRIS